MCPVCVRNVLPPDAHLEQSQLLLRSTSGAAMSGLRRHLRDTRGGCRAEGTWCVNHRGANSGPTGSVRSEPGRRFPGPTSVHSPKLFPTARPLAPRYPPPMFTRGERWGTFRGRPVGVLALLALTTGAPEWSLAGIPALLDERGVQ
jgi:hypothetical protein